MRAHALLLVVLALLAAPRHVSAQPDRLSKIGIVLQGGAYYPAIDGMRDGAAHPSLPPPRGVVGPNVVAVSAHPY